MQDWGIGYWAARKKNTWGASAAENTCFLLHVGCTINERVIPLRLLPPPLRLIPSAVLVVYTCSIGQEAGLQELSHGDQNDTSTPQLRCVSTHCCGVPRLADLGDPGGLYSSTQDTTETTPGAISVAFGGQSLSNKAPATMDLHVRGLEAVQQLHDNDLARRPAEHHLPRYLVDH
jgi:hypothetical protein